MSKKRVVGSKKKRVLTGEERARLFARQQRRVELNAIDEERRRRVANVNEWAAREQKKVADKYGRGKAIAE